MYKRQSQALGVHEATSDAMFEVLVWLLQDQRLLLILDNICLLYTSDAADDLPCVDLGGRRTINKQNNTSPLAPCYTNATELLIHQPAPHNPFTCTPQPRRH